MKRFYKTARRKVAEGGLNPITYDDEDEKIRTHEPIGPAVLPNSHTIVSPEMAEYEVVSVMSQMDMSRDEKAGYLAMSGFLPQAISAILAQVDGYTDQSEV